MTEALHLEVHNRSETADSIKVERVRSMFNVEAEAAEQFDLVLDLDLPDDWTLGAVVGPSGSGKTSLGAQIGRIVDPKWAKEKALVDSFDKGASFDDITGALASVGLGDVPAWLRPYAVLSMGEQFRANLARTLVDADPKVRWVLDEFTSVVDRQIARIGALAFGKAWKRKGGQLVVLSCHYDILPWLKPDWVLDMAGSTGRPEKGEGGTDPVLSTEAAEARDWIKPEYTKILDVTS